MFESLLVLASHDSMVVTYYLFVQLIMRRGNCDGRLCARINTRKCVFKLMMMMVGLGRYRRWNSIMRAFYLFARGTRLDGGGSCCGFSRQQK